jgi:hypothetical protein
MKKGMYYIPLILVSILNILFCLHNEDWYCFSLSTLIFLFLCEIYYLRFLK